ncbi:MAG: hypothetical protein P9L93_02950 [Candidatus Gorgyraea atricola]|nr:hypothetical protein [Candidatus Gorgyraea atricola]
MISTVREVFEEFKSKLELTKSLQDSITTHHNAIRNWIELNDPKIETHLIGSLQRKTRIQPNDSQQPFDIDILVVLGNFEMWIPEGGITPSNAIDEVEGIVSNNEKYKRMGPETDSPAIVLEYAGNIVIELIPAYIDNIGQAPDGTLTPPKGRGYWIPKNNRWTMADYDYDAEYTTKANKDSNDYLVPVIKMLKCAKRNCFPKMRSYHLEVMCSQIIPLCVQHIVNSGNEITYQELIEDFFYLAKENVLSSVKIPDSKSSNADIYMTVHEKELLADAFEKISMFCEKVCSKDGISAIKEWHKLFGNPFPSGG